ncbi:MAG: sugar phosphorylase [Gammaproteobacteria bacterium]|nr:sugar phosphorylase [Gammaproteobacteria bacterium]
MDRVIDPVTEQTELLPRWFKQRVESRLKLLYGEERLSALMSRLRVLVVSGMTDLGERKPRTWDEQDVLAITYGDSLRRAGEHPLATLDQLFNSRLREAFSGLHILPFFPFSSDDGFAVIDYRQVNPDLGDWSDIERIDGGYDLMIDLVINHVSRESLWFVDFVNNVEPGCDYFIEMPPETDVSDVVRPRNSPLLVPAHTHRGLRHVWATFGEDQIDLNFANPDVLFEFLDLLLFYVREGARYIRLDAIAYLWKKLGTRCIHLRETHEVVKLMRDLLDLVAPDVLLLTETNVPNGENLSYFGNSDEAHIVYQFALPPLLLHALHRGNAGYLTRWCRDMPRALKGCTYLNFAASHDGVGLRPVEGILPEWEVAELIDAMRRYGGYVGMKSDGNGKESPYEINISLFDALGGTVAGQDQWQVQRFLCSQVMMLAIQGIPAIYIHSLFATPNHALGVEQTGMTRAINRRKWDADELEALLNNPSTPNASVFTELTRVLQLRRHQPAFHPDGLQETVDMGPSLFALRRTSPDGRQRILAVSNVTQRPQHVALAPQRRSGNGQSWYDLLSSQYTGADIEELLLQPYQTVWLEDC